MFALDAADLSSLSGGGEEIDGGDHVRGARVLELVDNFLESVGVVDGGHNASRAECSQNWNSKVILDFIILKRIFVSSLFSKGSNWMKIVVTALLLRSIGTQNKGREGGQKGPAVTQKKGGMKYLVVGEDGKNISGLEAIRILETGSELLGLELELTKSQCLLGNGVNEDGLAGLDVERVGFEVVVDIDYGVNGFGV